MSLGMTNPASDLVNISKAAELLSVSFSTLRRWDKTGQLRSVRLFPGSPRRYRRADIDDLLRAA